MNKIIYPVTCPSLGNKHSWNAFQLNCWTLINCCIWFLHFLMGVVSFMMSLPLSKGHDGHWMVWWGLKWWKSHAMTFKVIRSQHSWTPLGDFDVLDSTLRLFPELQSVQFRAVNGIRNVDYTTLLVKWFIFLLIVAILHCLCIFGDKHPKTNC